MALSVELGAFARGSLLLLRLLFSPFLARRRSGEFLGGGSRSLFDSSAPEDALDEKPRPLTTNG